MSGLPRILLLRGSTVSVKFTSTTSGKRIPVGNYICKKIKEIKILTQLLINKIITFRKFAYYYIKEGSISK